MNWIYISILLVAVIIGLAIWKSRHNITLRNRLAKAEQDNNPDEIERIRSANIFPIPNWLRTGLIGLALVALVGGTFNQVFFYAEPGYIYHVRTITGDERVVDGVGYSMYLFGRINSWKKAMTVQSSDQSIGAGSLNAEGNSSKASASLSPQNIMFLDQVDADSTATVRFKLPTDRETFLKMAHEYRTPENLLRVALIPAFQETLQATASLMSAEDYYSGARTEFINEFENQMQHGIYLVKRKEIRSTTNVSQISEADASNPIDRNLFGDQGKTIFIVEKKINPKTGLPVRKEQKFILYGITVHEARVTDMRPNKKFVARMEQKQEASAKRAIAREQKIQEEEQRLLAIARGEREVAERQAEMKVNQIQVTTKAQTKKKEALIVADRQRQQARIQEETAQILLSKAKIDAQAVKVAAEAEAYKKEKIINADNALAQKLDAEIKIQRIWADAFAKRSVPQYVFANGSGDSGATPVGSDLEVKNFMQLMTLDAAKRLNYERDIISE